MDYSDKWLGLAGGGFGFSAIGGLGVYQVDLWHMGGNPTPIRALIMGKRLGATLQAEASHAVCLMTGVQAASSFSKIESNSVEWALSLGFKADNFIKAGSGAAKTISELAAHTTNWAAHETSKKAVQGMMGDFSFSPKGPNFVLLQTPFAVGIGAGIWYEWQTLTQTGTDIAWQYIKPRWQLTNQNDKVILKMNGIPEVDGARMNFQIKQKKFGPDDLLRWAVPPRREGKALLTGVVKNGVLTDPEMGLENGFDLSTRLPVGKTGIGVFSVSDNGDVERNKTIEIGVGVSRGINNLYKWESGDYAKVTTDATGKFVTTSDNRLKS
jgi:hypothetical protein